MPTGVQNEIIEAISEIDDLTVREYLGELIDPSRPQIKDGELPMVLIDYIGDEPINGQSEVRLIFNLYIIHVTQSSAPANRQKSNQSALVLLSLIDKSISLETKELALITLGRCKKIFDAASTKGYLSVYMRTLYAQKQRSYHLDRSNLL